MDTLTQKDASVWVQFRLGDKSYYLGDCTDLDTISNPRLGGIDYTFCWNGHRDGFVKRGKKYSPPGSIEVTLTQLMDETVSWLDRVAHCPVALYALKRSCGEAGVFKNWIRGSILYDAEMTGDEMGSYAHHVDDNETTHGYTFVAPPPRVDVWRPSVARLSIVETKDLNALACCDNLFCDDECGPYTIPGDRLIVGSDGGMAAKALLYHSEDQGATFTVEAAGGAWANAENIMAQACFEISKGVNRWLQARGSTAAKHMEVAYSDDGGATWKVVTSGLGSTDTEGATGPKALYAYDWQHIYLVTSEGNVYFSDDGGVTWELQDAATASGGNALNAISGYDGTHLLAVGDGDTVIYSLDGGEHWTAAAATGSADDLLSCQMFTDHRWLVGSDGTGVSTSSLFITFDGGVTYDERDFTGHDAEMVSDMSFCTPGVGLIVTNSQASFASGGSIHLTIDGGYSWEELVVPANSGLNAVVMVTPLKAFAVGNAHGGTAMVLSIGKG